LKTSLGPNGLKGGGDKKMEQKNYFEFYLNEFKGQLDRTEERMNKIKKEIEEPTDPMELIEQGFLPLGMLQPYHAAGDYCTDDGIQVKYFLLEGLVNVGLIPEEEFNPLKERFKTIIRFDAERIEDMVEGYAGNNPEKRQHRMECKRRGNDICFLEAILPYVNRE